MKRLALTVALCCAISGSALAGDIPSVDLKSTVPDEPTSTTISTFPGEIPTVNYTGDISDATLNFIQLMVGVFV
jgi:hypothetical protein